MEQKYHTIVTLLKYTRKIVGTEANCINLTHLYHDCLLPCISKVTSIDIGGEKLVSGYINSGS